MWETPPSFLVKATRHNTRVISQQMRNPFLATALTLFIAVPAIAQDDKPVFVPDFAMEKVVRRIVTWYFKPRTKPKKVYFAAEGIRKEWLPQIKNIEFVVLQTYDQPVYFFQNQENLGGRFTVHFGFGDPHCDATGDTWAFRIIDKRVKLFNMWASGWGMGCAAFP